MYSESSESARNILLRVLSSLTSSEIVDFHNLVSPIWQANTVIQFLDNTNYDIFTYKQLEENLKDEVLQPIIHIKIIKLSSLVDDLEKYVNSRSVDVIMALIDKIFYMDDRTYILDRITYNHVYDVLLALAIDKKDEATAQLALDRGGQFYGQVNDRNVDFLAKFTDATIQRQIIQYQKYQIQQLQSDRSALQFLLVASAFVDDDD